MIYKSYKMNHLTRFVVFVFCLTLTQLGIAQNNGGEDCVTATFMGTPGGPETCPGGTGYTGENTAMAAASTTNPSCDVLGTNNDLWYSFIAPSTGGVQLEIDLGSAGRIEAAVFDACGGNEVICNSSHSNGLMIMGLTPGDTFYLQLWSDAFVAGTFDFCIFEKQASPPNDDCPGSIELTLEPANDPCQMISGNLYNNFGTTASGRTPTPNCSNFGAGNDIWYHVIMPPSGSVTIEMTQAIGPQDWAMAAYTGACDNLTLIDCDDDSGTGLLPKIELSGRDPGEVVRLRIWEFGGDGFGSFELVALENDATPPSNNACSNAIDITAFIAGQGSCNPTCGHNVNASSSGILPLPNCGSFGSGNDVWYQAEVPLTGSISIELQMHMTSGPQDWAMAAYTGPCDSLTLIGCDDDSGPSLYPSLTLDNLVPGSIVYFRIWEFQGDDEGSFNICVKGFNPLAVSVLSFTGSSESDHNAITWLAEDMQKGDQFFLEYRGYDESQWQELSIMNSEKNVKKYSYRHYVPGPVSLYRLKTMNQGRLVHTSQVIVVDRLADEGGIKVFPVPSDGNVTIELPGSQITTGSCEYSVYDISGQHRFTTRVKDVNRRIELRTQDLPNGIYLLVITTDSGRWTERIVVER